MPVTPENHWPSPPNQPDAAPPPGPRPVESLPAAAPGPSDPGAPILSYARPGAGLAGRTVSVASCANAAEAGMIASELTGTGIPAQVVDHNTEVLGPYVGGAAVKVLVMAEDAGRARELLRLNASDEVEPLEEPAGSAGSPAGAPPVDEEGLPLRLAVAAAFDHPRRCARPPRCSPRRACSRSSPPSSPAAGGLRATASDFLLRVRHEDLERAEAVLEEAEAESGDEDEPRCPRCKSWRVFKQTSLLREIAGFFGFFGFGRSGGTGYECLACRHQGREAEFLVRRQR